MSSITFDTYNYTASILNRTKRHDDYLIPANLEECQIEDQLFDDRCAYLSQTNHETCFLYLNIIDYTTFLFCFGTRSIGHYVFTLAVIILLCLYLFLVLGVTADQFFCPALTVIAKVARMSETLAGVTLLAFGNGSPDLFMALANPHGDTELMYNELMGGGAFLISLIGGTIIIIRSFRIEPFKIARDCLFIMLAISYVGYAIHDKIFTFVETSIIILIYVSYIAVVLIERCFEEGGVIEIEKFVPDPNKEPYSLIMQVLVALNPFSEVGEDDSLFGKILLGIQTPIIVCLKLIIPIIDYTLERDGWCKLLNMWHCLLLPQIFLLATGLYDIQFGPIPLAFIVLLCSIPLFVSLAILTSKDEKPKYHILFAIGSFIGSICIISNTAKEIMSVLNVIGQATGLSHSIIGITVLSWGNSVGDLVSNVVLAQKGYARFGFAGCFGGAMFNCLTGIGITFILKLSAASNHVAFGRAGAMGPNCTTYILLLLIFVLIAFILTNFFARRVIGFYMLLIYTIFIFLCCLNEGQLIHPYGTDHSDQLKIQFGPLVYGDEQPPP